MDRRRFLYRILIEGFKLTVVIGLIVAAINYVPPVEAANALLEIKRGDISLSPENMKIAIMNPEEISPTYSYQWQFNEICAVDGRAEMLAIGTDGDRVLVQLNTPKTARIQNDLVRICANNTVGFVSRSVWDQGLAEYAKKKVLEDAERARVDKEKELVRKLREAK